MKRLQAFFSWMLLSLLTAITFHHAIPHCHHHTHADHDHEHTVDWVHGLLDLLDHSHHPDMGPNHLEDYVVVSSSAENWNKDSEPAFVQVYMFVSLSLFTKEIQEQGPLPDEGSLPHDDKWKTIPDRRGPPVLV